jgi:hypothetical protein
MDSILINLSRRAWIGSLAVHLILLAILILIINSQTKQKISIEEHKAVGKILIKQTNNGVIQYSGNKDEQSVDSNYQTIEEIVAGKFTDFMPSQPPPRIGIAKNTDIHSNINLFGINQLNSTNSSNNSNNNNSIGFNNNNSNGKKRLRVFNVQAEGNNFVFVFDKSDSMNEYNKIPFNSAKSELLRNIKELNDEKYKFNIIFYNDELHQWNNKGMLEATESNRKNAIDFIQSEIANGGTNHFQPLITAIKQKPDVIFFLTDGDDNDAINQIQLKEIKRINQINKTQINVIQFGVGKYRSSEFLIQLAKDNNGLYAYINVIELNQ